VNFDHFLAGADATRVCRVLEKFAIHDRRKFALTGSLALETHLIGLGHVPRARALNDVDIVVESIASIPEALAKVFLVRHIHPQVPEGKMLIQLVDPDAALRIDVFRAYGATMVRSESAWFGTALIQVVSLEDLAASATSLLMDLERGVAVSRKHAQDFQILAQVINLDYVEAAWRDHRKSTDPSTFEEALTRVHGLVESRRSLLVVPDYSNDADAACPRCVETGSFRPASPMTIMSILGYS
jgi:hypothetical protein